AKAGYGQIDAALTPEIVHVSRELPQQCVGASSRTPEACTDWTLRPTDQLDSQEICVHKLASSRSYQEQPEQIREFDFRPFTVGANM
ncbi:hypothetical protein, partial [Paraburkholderia sp. UYCP14C]|uniref:hypothetical protein n=1 Tax=Paraburkholderia sp. UYCP14C TaxID=2511130 RepID=UPI001B7D600C